jgi:hypothetical protein
MINKGDLMIEDKEEPKIRDIKALMDKCGESLPCPWDRDWGAASEQFPWHIYVTAASNPKPHRIWSCKTRQSACRLAKEHLGTYRKSGGYLLVHNYLTRESITLR